MLDTTNSLVKASDVATKPDTVEASRMRIWLDERVSASKKKPSAEIVTLTPALAQLLFDRNPINRPIGKYNAAALKSDVIGGRFVFNGESIVVSDTGILLDGQHRCLNVIATGISITTVIVFGPKEEARFTIDIGSPKTAPNFLAMKGRKDTNNLAAALGLYLQWRNDGMVSHWAKPTKTEIIAAANQFKGMDESVAAVLGATKAKLGSRSVLAFCHYVFWKRSSREAADYFIHKLIEGDALRKGDPILVCRKKLIELDRGVRQGTRVEYIFKSWNAHRNGETITSLRLSTAGKLPKVER